MAGITTNSSEIWSPHIFVKYGQVNRIPVKSAASNTVLPQEGTVVQYDGAYTITSTLNTTGAEPIAGICVLNDPAAKYAEGEEYPLSILPITLGAIISIPASLMYGSAVVTEGNLPAAVYVGANGQLCIGESGGNLGNNSNNASATPVNTTYPLGWIIWQDGEYYDFVFSGVGEFAAGTSLN